VFCVPENIHEQPEALSEQKAKTTVLFQHIQSLKTQKEAGIGSWFQNNEISAKKIVQWLFVVNGGGVNA
jgi:hypothetical protein